MSTSCLLTTCCGLNTNCPPHTHVMGHCFWSWYPHWEVGSGWKQWVIQGVWTWRVHLVLSPSLTLASCGGLLCSALLSSSSPWSSDSPQPHCPGFSPLWTKPLKPWTISPFLLFNCFSQVLSLSEIQTLCQTFKNHDSGSLSFQSISPTRHVWWKRWNGSACVSRWDSGRPTKWRLLAREIGWVQGGF